MVAPNGLIRCLHSPSHLVVHALYCPLSAVETRCPGWFGPWRHGIAMGESAVGTRSGS